jgi:hypothetical protein
MNSGVQPQCTAAAQSPQDVDAVDINVVIGKLGEQICPIPDSAVEFWYARKAVSRTIRLG